MIQARARHVVGENARVLAAMRALRDGQVSIFGHLMSAAHESMSRDYDASCREVDLLAELLRCTAGVLGARVTGAGWGGCVVALTEDRDLPLAEGVLSPYRQATGLDAGMFVCRSAPGARLLAKLENNRC